MKKLVIFSLFLHFFLCTIAGDFPIIGTKENALGMSSISYQNLTTQNPAFYAFQEKKAIAFYSQYHFSGVPILNLTLAYPVKYGKVFQFSCSSFSTDFYKDQVFSVGYGQKIGNKLALGMGFQSQLTQIPTYYSYHSEQVFLGTTYELTNKISIACVGKIALLNNIYQENEGRNLSNNHLQIGFLYHEKKWQLMSEIQQTISYPLILKAGFEYFLTENFSCQTGWNSQGRWGVGTQISLKSYKIGTTVNYQQFVGFVPHLSLQYAF